MNFNQNLNQVYPKSACKTNEKQAEATENKIFNYIPYKNTKFK